MSTSYESGFSAIELLITIFVGVAFLASGYELYSAVIRNGADTRNQTAASNVAYDYMRRNIPGVSNPCAASTPVTTTPVTDTNPSTIPAAFIKLNPTVTVTISCPYGTASGTSLVTSTVVYGNTSPTKQVTHAIYATK